MLYLTPGAAITNWIFQTTVISCLPELFHPCHPWAKMVSVSHFLLSNSTFSLVRRLEIQNQDFDLSAGPCSL